MSGYNLRNRIVQADDIDDTTSQPTTLHEGRYDLRPRNRVDPVHTTTDGIALTNAQPQTVVGDHEINNPISSQNGSGATTIPSTASMSLLNNEHNTADVTSDSLETNFIKPCKHHLCKTCK